MIGLNAGCGDHAPPGWINLDAYPSASAAAILADARDLPFASGTVDRVFASHLLEHLTYFDGAWQALTEFRRVLRRETGRLAVICPDIERAVMLGEPPALLRQIIAWPDEWILGDWAAKRPPIGHAWTATAVLVGRQLESAGFTIEATWSGRLHKLAASGWPVLDTGDWQCAYTAIP